jgi:hypothetical protein
MDTIEGYHWIFDRYAWLGLPRDADADDIKAAIKRKRVENHPDAIRGRGEEIQRVAAQQNALIAKCEEILNDPGRKEAFDAKLEKFQAERPHAVSADGVARISLDDMMMDVAGLLSDPVHDSALDALAVEMSGFDEKSYRLAKKMVTADPDDEEAREAFRSMAARKLVRDTILEARAWSAAGLSAPPRDGQVMHADDHVANVRGLIDSVVQDAIPTAAAAASGAALIGMAPTLLLPGASGSATAPVSDALARSLEERFRERSTRVLEAAERRQESLAEMARLARLEVVAPPDGDSRIRIYLARGEEALMGFDLDIEKHTMSSDEETREPVPLDTIRAAGKPSAIVWIDEHFSEVYLILTTTAERLTEMHRRSAPVP